MYKVVEKQAIDTAEQYKSGMEEGFAFLGQGKPVYWYKGTPEPVCKGAVQKVPFITHKTTEGNYIILVYENNWIVTGQFGGKTVYTDREFKSLFSIISIIQVV